MGITKIQWADRTDNFARGCTRVSEGCENCYIPTTAALRTRHIKFDRDGIGATTGVELAPHVLLSWFTAKPERHFVNSLSDTFHKAIPDDLLARAFASMALAEHHIFLILTKRHGRMRALLNSPALQRKVAAAYAELSVLRPVQRLVGKGVIRAAGLVWPVPNLHLGVSVENQQRGRLRIPALLDTPAAVRWLSCEPLLGPVDLDPWCRRQFGPDWVVIGGESHRTRPRRMDQAWADHLLTQCREAAVPVFYKQTGTVLARELGLKDPKGGDQDEWPVQWPRQYPGDDVAPSAVLV